MTPIKTSVDPEFEKVVSELKFQTLISSAMLSTLDVDHIFYVILCGVTSGDGMGFNRGFLFLDDEAGRAIRLAMALGPASNEEAINIWNAINRDQLDLPHLFSRYPHFQKNAADQHISQRMAGFVLPSHNLESFAVPPHSLLVDKTAPLMGVLARCMVNRTPFASNGLTVHYQKPGSNEMSLEFRNIAIVPLIVGSKLLGAILADNEFTRNPVAAEHLHRLHALSNLAALSIDRARLHAKTVAITEVDGLTGVYNRGYYEIALERLLEATRRTGETLSLVIFDIDHFKRCNDTHGHHVGDRVLKEVAQRLIANIRQSDLLARYGGEEFVLLLPNTAQDAAIQVAEKLREAVKNSELFEGHLQDITLSGGVTSTQGFEAAIHFFERADKALYQAKSRGRDCIVVVN